MTLWGQQQYFLPGLTIEQDFETRFEIYNTENGLSHNSAFALFQDSKGYMWFGTENGLNKFDGYSIQVYENKETNSNSISGNFINDITEDSLGNLFVATSSGLNLYNRFKDDFIRIGVDSLSPFFMPDQVITALLVDEYGILWANSLSGYLYRFNFKDSTMEYFVHLPSGAETSRAHHLQLDGDSIWIFYRGAPAVFDRSINKFRYFKDIKFSEIVSDGIVDNLSESKMSFMFKDSLGNYYFGDYNGKGLYYDRKNKVLKQLRLASFYCTFSDSQGNIWIGGYVVGATKYMPEKNRISLIKTIPACSKCFPSNMVWDIIEDKAGNMWFATANGVAKLSASSVRFKHISSIPNNPNSLISNYVQVICQRKNGDIWIGTKSGISVFSEDWKFKQKFISNSEDKTTLRSPIVRALYEDADQIMNVGYWAGLGFSRFDDSKNQFVHFQQNSISNEVNGNDWYIGFVEDTAKNLYPLTWGGLGINHFDKKEERFTLKTFLINGLLYGVKVTVLSYFNQKLFFSHFGQYDFNKEKRSYFIPRSEIHRYIFIKDMDKIGNALPTTMLKNEQINYFFIADTNFYFLTNFGLLRYLPDKQDFYRFPINLNIKRIAPSVLQDHYYIGHTNGLSLIHLSSGKSKASFDSTLFGENKITALLKTHDRLWIGTKDGLFFISDKEVEQGKTVAYLSNDSQLHQSITTLANDRNGVLWIGTAQGVFTFKDGKVLKYFNPQNSKLSSFFINEILCDSLGQIWIATLSGLNLFMPKTSDFKTFHHDINNPLSLSHEIVYQLSEGENVIYLGTGFGVSTIHKKTHKIQRLNRDKKHLMSQLVTCGLADKKGNIWLGFDQPYRFVVKINPYINKIEYFHDEPFLANTFRGNMAYTIYEDEKGFIWIGSDKGLNKYNPSLGTFSFFGPDNGLPSAEVKSIVSDNAGNIWLGTPKGLVMIDPKTMFIDIYDRRDGVPFFTFIEGAALRLQDGRMLFGSSDGLLLFHPDDLKRSKKPHQIVFSQLFVNKQFFAANLDEKTKISFQSSQNELSIELADLNFINTQRIQYSFRLTPSSFQWTSLPKGENVITLSNLSSGDYKLEVRATNHDGVWGDESQSIEFTIHPPWYLTNWAYFSFGFLLILMVYLIFRLRLYHLKERSKKLEKEVVQRTHEVIAKNEELANNKIAELINRYQIEAAKTNRKSQEELRLRIASELHDGVGGSLTGIKLYINALLRQNPSTELELLLKDLEKTYQQVRNISRDLIPPDFVDISIKEIILDYIYQIKERSQININFIIHPQKGWEFLDETLQVELYRISQELITNAIKHSQATQITFQFLMANDRIQLQIEDNGIGFDMNQKSSGIGLKTLEFRVKNNNGSMEMETSPGKGLFVSIELPAKKLSL
ncbi:MAG: hypothetical protein JXR34_13400 [Bacteroidales bacterium]|nr:hypothetical protein [Bacteroidales bacterium]